MVELYSASAKRILFALLGTTTAGVLFAGYQLHQTQATVQRLVQQLNAANGRIEQLNVLVLSSQELLDRELRKRLDAALPPFVTSAAAELSRRTLPELRARRLLIVDSADEKRIELGIGTSPYSGDPNTFVALYSPEKSNPILLSTTAESASVSVNARSFLSSNKKGQSSIAIFQDSYIKGAKPVVMLYGSAVNSSLALNDQSGTQRAYLAAVDKDVSLVLRDSTGSPSAVIGTRAQGSWIGLTNDQGQIRAGLGSVTSGEARFFVNNKSVEIVYSVASNHLPHVETFAKEDPSSKMWSAASTFSTLKTFWDIFRR